MSLRDASNPIAWAATACLVVALASQALEAADNAPAASERGRAPGQRGPASGGGPPVLAGANDPVDIADDPADPANDPSPPNRSNATPSPDDLTPEGPPDQQRVGHPDDPVGFTTPSRELEPGLGSVSDSGSDESTGDAGGEGMGSWGLQTAMALAVVIALIFAVRVWLRKMSGAPGGPTSRGLVEVLGRTTVGPKTQVIFLRINERVIVAGQTPAGMTTLASISEPDEVATLLAQADADRPQSISQGFGKLLKQFEREGGEAPRDRSTGEAGVIDRARGEMGDLVGRLRSLRAADRDMDERDRE